VIGISMAFMAVDISGGVFSILSLAFKEKFDVFASSTYAVVIASHLFFLPHKSYETYSAPTFTGYGYGYRDRRSNAESNREAQASFASFRTREDGGGHNDSRLLPRIPIMNRVVGKSRPEIWLGFVRPAETCQS
jgi:hypothetical protein